MLAQNAVSRCLAMLLSAATVTRSQAVLVEEFTVKYSAKKKRLNDEDATRDQCLKCHT